MVEVEVEVLRMQPVTMSNFLRSSDAISPNTLSTELEAPNERTVLNINSLVIQLSSLKQTVINSINLLMGIGLLSMPYAISKLGWILGFSLLITFSLVACYTAELLGRLMSIEVDGELPRSMYDVAVRAFGKKFRNFMVIVFTLDLFLVSVANVILFSDSLSSIFPSLVPYKSLLKFISVACLTPLTWSNSISKIAWLSSVGVFSLFLLILVVFFDGVSTTISPGSLRFPAMTSVAPSSWPEIGLGAGLMFAGLNAHAALPSIYSQMKKPQYFSKSMEVTYSIVGCFYGAIGSIGYLMFGATTLPEISQNLPLIEGYNGILTSIALWAITINPLTKFALILFPMNSMIESMFSRFISKFRVRHIYSRTLTAVLVLATAIVFPSFQLVLAFVGSVFSFLIVVIFPTSCYLKLEWKSMKVFERVLCIIVFVAGLGMMVFGTVGVIYST